MYFVYVIQSISDPNQTYVGCTQNLKERLSNHNSGTTTHTDKYRPWRLIVYIAFVHKDKAYAFEEYLKSGSGRVFKQKRLI